MRRYLAHIHLAGDDIGDETFAVFPQQFNLALRGGNSGVDLGRLRPKRDLTIATCSRVGTYRCFRPRKRKRTRRYF